MEIEICKGSTRRKKIIVAYLPGSDGGFIP